MAEKVFPKGLIFKAPHPKAPSFVKGSLSIKVEEFVPFIQENVKNGWVNIDLKESKNGKMYAELNTWEKGQQSASSSDITEEEMRGGEITAEDVNPEDIPY